MSIFVFLKCFIISIVAYYIYVYRLNQIDPSIVPALNARGITVFGINLNGNAIVSRYLLPIVGNNERFVGRVGNPSALLVENTLAIRQLSSAISSMFSIVKCNILHIFQMQHRSSIIYVIALVNVILVSIISNLMSDYICYVFVAINSTI